MTRPKISAEERTQLKDEIDAGIHALTCMRKSVYTDDPELIFLLYTLSSRLTALIYTLAKDTSNEL